MAALRTSHSERAAGARALSISKRRRVIEKNHSIDPSCRANLKFSSLILENMFSKTLLAELKIMTGC
jgi:hypothetical protein